MRVDIYGGSISNNEIEWEKLKTQLDELTRKLRRAVLEGSDKNRGEKTLKEIKTLRKKMNLIGRFGESLQRSYLAEAAYCWKNEKFSESEAALRKAIELNPLGKPELNDWDNFAASFSTFAFEKEIARVYQKSKGFCDTTLSIAHKNVNLQVNGFELKEKRRLKLAVQAMHLLVARDSLGQMQEVVLHCPKKSNKSLVIDLSKNGGVRSELSLEEIQRGSNVNGVFVLKFKKEVLELAFFSQKGGLSPLVLEKKVSVQDVLLGSQDLKLPLDYATFNSILVQHLGPRSVNSFPTNPVLANSEEKFRNPRKQWYNNPIVWGIVGGLAVGAATTYIFTKEGESSHPQASVKVDLN